MSDADILGGGYPPPPPPPPYMPPAKGDRGVLGTAVLIILAGLCGAALVLAGAQIVREMNRPPTAVEKAKATAQELAQRWQAWPAGRILPTTLSYTTPDSGGPEKARRIGIDPSSTCRDGLDAPGVTLADGGGCRAVLRATYIDQTQGLLITIGVVAFADESSATRFRGALPTDNSISPGLRAYGPTGSVASRFTDGARQVAVWAAQGPYAVGAVVGYADGRPAVSGRDRLDDLRDLADRLVPVVLDPLATPLRADCSQKAFQC